MDQIGLRPFAHFYRNARHLGADAVLRRHLELDDDFVVPAYVPHGVDFGFSIGGFDICKPEPLYWATNGRLASLAEPHKPVVKMPHPFLMAAATEQIGLGKGTLVIGPPPGPKNDRNLLALLDASDRDAITILVKNLRGSGCSLRFWQRAGFATVSLADLGDPTYPTLMRLLSRYRNVVSGTLSSAIFFAAALGKRVRLLRGYRYRAYEGLHVHNWVDYGASAAAQVVRAMAEGSVEETTQAARALLGEDYAVEPSALRRQLLDAIARLKSPVYCRHSLPLRLQKALAQAALRLNRPSLLLTSLGEFVRGRITRDVLVVEVDELALWLDGPSPANLRFDRVRYIPGEREPGFAADGY